MKINYEDAGFTVWPKRVQYDPGNLIIRSGRVRFKNDTNDPYRYYGSFNKHVDVAFSSRPVQR